MAVLPEVPGLRVQVKVEGSIVPDYVDPEPPTESDGNSQHPRGSFYVESRTGAAYRVQVDFTLPFFTYVKANPENTNVTPTCVQLELFADGERKEGVAWPQLLKQPYPKSHDLRSICKVSQDESVAHDLVFDSVHRVEDANSKRVREDGERARKMGKILVRLAIGLCQRKDYVPESCKSPNSQPLQFAEKSLKGSDVSHGTSIHPVGETLSRSTGSLSATQIVCEFQFSYRSRDVLQLLEIVPRDNPRLSRLASMSREELLALAERRLEPDDNAEDGFRSRSPSKTIKAEPRDGDRDESSIDLTVNRKRKRVEVDLTED